MWRAIAVFLAAASGLAAQQVVSTRIFTEPAGGHFYVDGMHYVNSATFLWPEKSKHTLSAENGALVSGDCRISYDNWVNSLEQVISPGLAFTFTAERNITWLKAVGVKACPVMLDVYGGDFALSCAGGPNSGKIIINNSCYAADATLWLNWDETVIVQAFAPPGWVFMGWNWGALGSAWSTSFRVTGPITLKPQFALAARVTFTTAPAGFQVYVDRTAQKTPIAFDWAEGSIHHVGAVSPQRDDHGGLWIFDSWNDKGGENHDYTTGRAHNPVTLVCKYVPGVAVGVASKPPGLPLIVDGRSDWPRATFVWGLGSKHTIAAPAELPDASGRRYSFRSWSNGGAATQEVTVTAGSPNWIAAYDKLSRLVLRSTPDGVSLTVDGQPCTTPCTIDRERGAAVSVAAPATAAARQGERLAFQGWSDGAAASHGIRLDADEQVVVAAYRSSYRLTASADPTDAGVVRLQPSSADGYYETGTAVQIVAEPHQGYRFRRWEGDLAGTLPSATVRISRPCQVRAVMESTNYVPPPVVRNAAGETRQPGVAPGSIIAIYGTGLAGKTATGPAGPLPQTLGGVTVRIGQRLLPLFFVSTGQINAQVPSDLAEGSYTAAVGWEGHPEQEAELILVRNAPGLFARAAGDILYAVASHEDGSSVSAESPARPGETITLFGTGFGPYNSPAPDGFPVPEAFELRLVDPVVILAGDQALEVESAIAAQGQVGVVAVRLRIPETLTGRIEIRAVVNGNQSNPVDLPVE